MRGQARKEKETVIDSVVEAFTIDNTLSGFLFFSCLTISPQLQIRLAILLLLLGMSETLT